MQTRQFIGQASGEIMSWPHVHSVDAKESWGNVSIKVRFGFRLANTWTFSAKDIAATDSASSLLGEMESHIASAGDKVFFD